MLRNFSKNVLSISAALILVVSAQASAVVSSWVPGTSGLILPVGLDLSVGGPNENLTDIFYLNEGIMKTSVAPVPLDVPFGGSVPPGVSYNSDYFFAQDTGTPALKKEYSIDITFRNKIIGWERIDNPSLGITTLTTGDALAGLPGYIYPSGKNRQLESHDKVVQTGPKTLSVSLITYNTMDSFRVLTFVPEPSTYMILGGSLGLAMLMMYRRRRAVHQQ